MIGLRPLAPEHETDSGAASTPRRVHPFQPDPKAASRETGI